MTNNGCVAARDRKSDVHRFGEGSDRAVKDGLARRE